MADSNVLWQGTVPGLNVQNTIYAPGGSQADALGMFSYSPTGQLTPQSFSYGGQEYKYNDLWGGGGTHFLPEGAGNGSGDNMFSQSAWMSDNPGNHGYWTLSDQNENLSALTYGMTPQTGYNAIGLPNSGYDYMNTTSGFNPSWFGTESYDYSGGMLESFLKGFAPVAAVIAPAVLGPMFGTEAAAGGAGAADAGAASGEFLGNGITGGLSAGAGGAGTLGGMETIGGLGGGLSAAQGIGAAGGMGDLGALGAGITTGMTSGTELGAGVGGLLSGMTGDATAPFYKFTDFSSGGFGSMPGNTNMPGISMPTGQSATPIDPAAGGSMSANTPGTTGLDQGAAASGTGSTGSSVTKTLSNLFSPSNPLSAATRALDFLGITKNGSIGPNALPAAALMMSMANQNKNAKGLGDAQKTLSQTIQPVAQLGQQLISQYQSGQLNVADAKAINDWESAQLAQSRQYYAKAGLSDSSMAVQAEGQIHQQAQAMRDQALQNMLKVGLSAVGQASQPLTQLAQQQVSQDAALQQAMANFLMAMAQNSITSQRTV